MAMRYPLDSIWQAIGGTPELAGRLNVTGSGSLPSIFAVTDFATATIGAAGLAIAELVEHASGKWPGVTVDRRLASFWFSTSLRPSGWLLPPEWDAVAGNYRGADGWIRLHTNAPHHRAAALAVLGVGGGGGSGVGVDRESVARAVSGWNVQALETAIVEANGCAAAMRTRDEWSVHPQGQAVNSEPLLHRVAAGQGNGSLHWSPAPNRPLQGIRVLDLTRILAGPVATRFLAGYGADVLRIDPFDWEEPVAAPEVTLGKRCARLDLKQARDLEKLESLIMQADIFVHGYRSDALTRLGIGRERRRALNPALIDVCLDAYGWTGPWNTRRGFDSLVQMSSGIADAGMRAAGANEPKPLPCQALDHGTGYLLAAAAVRGLTERISTSAGLEIRASLARTAQLLLAESPGQPDRTTLAAEQADDLDMSGTTEMTSWGPARRLKPPARIERAPMYWDHPASALGSSPAEWHC